MSAERPLDQPEGTVSDAEHAEHVATALRILAKSCKRPGRAMIAYYDRRTEQNGSPDDFARRSMEANTRLWSETLLAVQTRARDDREPEPSEAAMKKVRAPADTKRTLQMIVIDRSTTGGK